MNFQQAVELMSQGKLLRRKGWYRAVTIVPGKRKGEPVRWGLMARVRSGDSLYWRTCYGDWFRPNPDDVLTDDWELVEEETNE